MRLGSRSCIVDSLLPDHTGWLNALEKSKNGCRHDVAGRLWHHLLHSWPGGRNCRASCAGLTRTESVQDQSVEDCVRWVPAVWWRTGSLPSGVQEPDTMSCTAQVLSWNWGWRWRSAAGLNIAERHTARALVCLSHLSPVPWHDGVSQVLSSPLFSHEVVTFTPALQCACPDSYTC